MLSVVIPTYQGLKLLQTCLESVRRHCPPHHVLPIEILVVDDGSTDGTAAWVRDQHPSVRIVRNARNLGFAGAANAGIAAARGDYVQLLNNDTEVCEGWAEAGLRPFDDVSVGSVAPLVLLRSDPSRVDSAGDQYSLVGWPTKRGHGEPSARWIGRPADEVFGPSGSSAIYRADLLRRVGGFDERLGAYYEDIDLAFRLRWAGYRCVFEPACRILHEVSATYRHDRPELQRQMSRNAELVFWRNMPSRWMPVAVPAHLVFLAVQAGWRASRGRFSPFLQGKRDALFKVPEIRADRAFRRALLEQAPARPRFPLWINPLSATRNHVMRPAEASSRHLLAGSYVCRKNMHTPEDLHRSTG